MIEESDLRALMLSLLSGKKYCSQLNKYVIITKSVCFETLKKYA